MASIRSFFKTFLLWELLLGLAVLGGWRYGLRATLITAAGVLVLECDSGVECLATCFTPGVA